MTSCCCIDFDGYNDIFNQQVVKARKEHKCCECRSCIEPGSLYERTSLLYDGSWSHYKTCARCANVSAEYFKCGHHYTELVWEFKECYGFDYRDGIPKDFAPCKN